MHHAAMPLAHIESPTQGGSTRADSPAKKKVAEIGTLLDRRSMHLLLREASLLTLARAVTIRDCIPSARFS